MILTSPGEGFAVKTGVSRAYNIRQAFALWMVLLCVLKIIYSWLCPFLLNRMAMY